MKHELETTKQNNLATVADLAGLGFDPKDIMLPKILLLQGTSVLVNEGKGLVNGDIINSLTGQKIGDKNNSIEVLPISRFKTWTVLEKGTGKFVKSEPRGSEEREYEEALPSGQIVNNYATLNFYVLPVKAADEGITFPALISFRSKSLTAGKKLMSHCLAMAMNGAPEYAKSVLIGCQFTKNEKGSFHVFSVTPGKKTEAEGLRSARLWAGVLAQNAVKVDEAHESDSSEVVDEQSAPF